MGSYRLNEDLDRLYEHSVLTFGLIRADHYYDGLIQRFHELIEKPRLCQTAGHIHIGYAS